MGAILGAIAQMAGNALGQREQYEQQHHMVTHQYRHAADDLEKAGLNRILALGSPAAASPGASFQSPDFANAYNQGKLVQQQVATAKAQEELLRSQVDKTSAEAANIRTQTMVASEMLPVQKHQGVSMAEQATTQAELNQVNRLLQGLEHDKQEILKSLYSEFGPMILDVVKAVKESLSNARDANDGWLDNLSAMFGMGGSSARDASERNLSDAQIENMAQAIIRNIEESEMPFSTLMRLSPRLRNAVFSMRPDWRK